MKMKHMLLEVYCKYKSDHKGEIQCCLKNKVNELGCFENNCKYLSYTYCPNEIAYSGNTGLIQGIEDFISFGGEMDANIDSDGYEIYRKKLLTKWEEVCKNKISEAYDEYIRIKKVFLIKMYHSVEVASGLSGNILHIHFTKSY